MFRSMEKDRVFLIAEIRASGGINTGISKPFEQFKKIERRLLTFERK